MMTIHLICKYEGSTPKGLTRIDKENNLWSTGNWDIGLSDAEKLVGGMVFLHETKSQRSYFGGCIVSFEKVDEPSLAREERVAFVFRNLEEGKGQVWRGQDHAMAWTSGVIAGE
jgi:hypothetical protein